MTSKAPRHVLRNILRKLKTPSSPEASQPFRDYVMANYKTSNAPVSAQRQQIASEYSMLLSDLSERLRLQKLDTGAEEKLTPKEMSRRAAARAGLQLPKLDPDL